MNGSSGRPGWVLARRRCCHFCCHALAGRRWVMSQAAFVHDDSRSPSSPRTALHKEPRCLPPSRTAPPVHDVSATHAATPDAVPVLASPRQADDVSSNQPGCDESFAVQATELSGPDQARRRMMVRPFEKGMLWSEQCPRQADHVWPHMHPAGRSRFVPRIGHAPRRQRVNLRYVAFGDAVEIALLGASEKMKPLCHCKFGDGTLRINPFD